MADRKLTVKIIGDDRSLRKAFATSQKAGKTWSVSMGSIVKGALAFGVVSEGLEAIGSGLRAAAGEWSDQAKAAAQTQAVIKSTGGVANVTARQVDNLANSLQRQSGIDDEIIKSGENLLLTFKNVRNEVGKGNAVFDRATQAAVDLSVAGFGSIDSTAKQLGKALNDPVKGMTALGRAGVTFTQAQKDQIKAMVKANDLLGAQRLILKEVESQVGGSARALGKTLPGQLNRLRETFKNTLGDLASSVAPALNSALGFVNSFVDKLSAAKTVRAKFNVVVDQIRGLVESITQRIREINFRAVAQTVGDALRRVDWGEVGRAISDGIKDSLAAVSRFLQSVDWGLVGREIVRGIREFLVRVDWVALAVGTVKLLVAAFIGASRLLLGVGRELAVALRDGIVAGLKRIAPAIGRAALRVALAIIEPLNFTVLGRHIIPGLNTLVNSMKAKLRDLEVSAAATSASVSNSLSQMFATVNTAKGALPEAQQHLRQDPNAATKAATTVRRAASTVTEATKKVATATKKSTEATKKNTTEVQKNGLAALKQAADLARAAELTERNARQFRLLGLDAEGNTPIPGVRALRKQLSNVGTAIRGTFLDTRKVRSLLGNIRRVLSGGLGAVSKDVRAKIQEMLANLNQQLKDNASGPLTKFHKASANALLAGIGLSPDQVRALRARLSQVGAGGTVHPGGFGAFGTALSIGGGTIVVNHTSTLDGQVIERSTTKHQQRRRRRNPPQKRGVINP